MDKLTFKDFVWPRNPEHYRVSRSWELAYNEADDPPTLLGVSGLKRVVTGSGVFSGETAYDDFKALAELSESSEIGWLEHPVWGKMRAFLTQLEMTQEPRENYVAYSFTFVDGEETGLTPE